MRDYKEQVAPTDYEIGVGVATDMVDSWHKRASVYDGIPLSSFIRIVGLSYTRTVFYVGNFFTGDIETDNIIFDSATLWHLKPSLVHVTIGSKPGVTWPKINLIKDTRSWV